MERPKKLEYDKEETLQWDVGHNWAIERYEEFLPKSVEEIEEMLVEFWGSPEDWRDISITAYLAKRLAARLGIKENNA